MRTLTALLTLALVAAAHAAPPSSAAKPDRASAARKAGALARQAAKLAQQAAELARQAEETAREGEASEDAAPLTAALAPAEPAKSASSAKSASAANSASTTKSPSTTKSASSDKSSSTSKPVTVEPATTAKPLPGQPAAAAKSKPRAAKARPQHRVELPSLASHADRRAHARRTGDADSACEPDRTCAPDAARAPARRGPLPRACPTSYAPARDPATGRAPLTVCALRDSLTARFRTQERRRKVLGVRELDCYPVLIFHERFRFETFLFAQRLYDRADYRFQKPQEVALTLDEGGHAPADMNALYEQPEPSLCVIDSPSGPIVVSVSCPEFPPPYRNRPRTPREPDRFPPDVLIGRLDADGRLIPAANLPSIQAGWRYAFDPFCGGMVRIHAGRFFGPPDGDSTIARTFTNRELVIRDAAGHRLCGARIAVALMPNEPEGILVVEHEGLRIPIGTSGPRERALTEDLRSQPGTPVRVDRVQFAVQAFRAEGVDLEPDGIRLLPHALP